MKNLLSINIIPTITQLKAIRFDREHWVILGLLMLMLFGSYLIYRTKRRKKREKKLETQVLERTDELNELNILLEETNQALHQEKIRVEEQKELLENQSQELLQTNELLNNRNKEVEIQNQQLEKYRNHLEEMITDRTKELIEAKKRAEESDHLKSSFLANMSHEIRTPMNAVLGFADLLDDPDLTYEERKNYLNIINKNGNALLFLINDIIDISKIEAGQMKIIEDEFCVDDLLSELHENYTLNNRKPNLKIVLNEEAKSEKFLLKSDPERIRQVLNNLLSNAVKFTESGFIEFGYSITSFKDSQNAENDDFIQFYVKDTGIGIAPDQQRVIFERFFKIEDYKTQLYRGAGLGLTISKSLVELLGGKIWVDSKVNVGTTFYFTIPIPRLSRTDFPKINTENRQDNYEWESKKILIAEDEETNFYFLETVLKKTKATILWAKDGKEALQFFEAHSDIDIILMDIKMPAMNGYEATVEIKKMNPNAIVIAQTAYSMANEQQEIMKAGFDDYISKPIKANSILKMLQKYFFSKDIQ